MSNTAVLQILNELIAINTISGQENNKIASYLKRKLFKYFWKEVFVTVKGKKLSNLLFKIPGKRKAIPLIVSMHMDTIPITPRWKTNPYHVIKKNDKMYGLGISDMKASMAAWVCTALLAKQKPSRDIYFAFDADEETSGLGVKEIIRALPLKKANTIVAEPTDLNLVYAHKGCIDMEFTFYGKSKHASQTDYFTNQRSNAILKATKFIQFAQNLNKKIHVEKNILGFPTLSVCMIAGGTSINAIPSTCTVSLTLRTNSQQNHSKYFTVLCKIAKKVDKKSKIVTLFNGKSYTGSKNSIFAKNIMQIIQTRHKKARYFISQGWCNAVHFAKLGSVIILGPGTKKIIHQPNEYCKTVYLERYALIAQKIMQTI